MCNYDVPLLRTRWLLANSWKKKNGVPSSRTRWLSANS